MIKCHRFITCELFEPPVILQLLYSRRAGGKVLECPHLSITRFLSHVATRGKRHSKEVKIENPSGVVWVRLKVRSPKVINGKTVYLNIFDRPTHIPGTSRASTTEKRI